MKINNCSTNDEVKDLILKLYNVQIKKTTSNADYASMLAFDGEDTIEAKIWNFSDDLKNKLVNGEVYAVSGKIKDYQGKMQLNINDIKKVTSEDVDLSCFYEYAKVDVRVLQSEIEDYIKQIDNVILRDITIKILKQNYKDYFLYPAAVSMHHNYYNGLAYHIYSMLKLSDAYLKQYQFLNKNLVYTGIILHDIGKLVELSGPKGTEYTKTGNLLGHISIGANEIYATAKEMSVENSEEVQALLHIILSHHGKLEYGSPKEPMMAEAMVIHFLDLNDSKLAALEKEIDSTPKGEYTNPILSLDRKSFYKANID